jgi:hypothetical protein
VCIIFLGFGPLGTNSKESQQTRSISGLLILCPLVTFQHSSWIVNPLRAPQVTGGSGVSFFSLVGDEFMVRNLAEVFSWVPSMAVTGLMHQRGSHVGHHSHSRETQAYPWPVVSKGSGPCRVFVSKFFQRTGTGGQVFYAWKCFS